MKAIKWTSIDKSKAIPDLLNMSKIENLGKISFRKTLASSTLITKKGHLVGGGKLEQEGGGGLGGCQPSWKGNKFWYGQQWFAYLD